MSSLRFLLVSLLLWTAPTLAEEAEDWISRCQRQGFDPWQLACRTCDLVPPEGQEICRTCCQSFKDVEPITKPYEAAILAVNRRTLEDFLEEDWEPLVALKGKDRLVRIEKGEDAVRHFFFYSPSVLFFLDEKPKRTLTYQQAQERAKETIYLDGWKREDIRDMLGALLP